MEADVRFLSSCNIIDYSLLLGKILSTPEEVRKLVAADPELGRGVYFCKGDAYVMGIIDPLTGFSDLKKLEYFFKNIKYDKKQSCIPPTDYADRFMDFM